MDVSWSKTIQFGNRTLQLPVLKVENPFLCPLRWIKDLRLHLGPPGEPLFSDGGWVLTASHLQDAMRTWLRNLGLDGKEFTLHSLRHGGASWAFVSGLPQESIQVLGDWASNAYLRYLDHSLDVRLDAMVKFSHRM